MNRNRNIILVCSGLTFLVSVFFIGTPFEFLNSFACTIAFYLALLFILCLFVFLFRKTKRIGNKFFKWLLIGALATVAIPYFIIGVMWEDVKVYTNDKNEKVIRQRRETSGSIYDSRDRKIIADFGQFRVSFDCNAKKLKGIWTEYEIATGKTKMKIFDD